LGGKILQREGGSRVSGRRAPAFPGNALTKGSIGLMAALITIEEPLQKNLVNKKGGNPIPLKKRDTTTRGVKGGKGGKKGNGLEGDL